MREQGNLHLNLKFCCMYIFFYIQNLHGMVKVFNYTLTFFILTISNGNNKYINLIKNLIIVSKLTVIVDIKA